MIYHFIYSIGLLLLYWIIGNIIVKENQILKIPAGVAITAFLFQFIPLTKIFIFSFLVVSFFIFIYRLKRKEIYFPKFSKLDYLFAFMFLYLLWFLSQEFYKFPGGDDFCVHSLLTYLNIEQKHRAIFYSEYLLPSFLKGQKFLIHYPNIPHVFFAFNTILLNLDVMKSLSIIAVFLTLIWYLGIFYLVKSLVKNQLNLILLLSLFPFLQLYFNSIVYGALSSTFAYSLMFFALAEFLRKNYKFEFFIFPILFASHLTGISWFFIGLISLYFGVCFFNRRFLKKRIKKDLKTIIFGLIFTFGLIYPNLFETIRLQNVKGELYAYLNQNRYAFYEFIWNNINNLSKGILLNGLSFPSNLFLFVFSLVLILIARAYKKINLKLVFIIFWFSTSTLIFLLIPFLPVQVLTFVFPRRMISYYYSIVCLISLFVTIDFKLKINKKNTLVYFLIFLFIISFYPYLLEDYQRAIDYTSCFKERDYEAWIYIKQNSIGPILGSDITHCMYSTGVRSFPYNLGKLSLYDDKWISYNLINSGNKSKFLSYLKEKGYKYIYVTETKCFGRKGFDLNKLKEFNFTFVYNKNGSYILEVS
ncbi:MAG: hypothetical protein B6U78_02910 [Candidatus Aenigmarchaeota archaeon ex4484_224]|nr:MAG: hypothetical protein B6U78_02910 [Candidatus Aenigmarchaeota archaeon ex4484_224]